MHSFIYPVNGISQTEILGPTAWKPPGYLLMMQFPSSYVKIIKLKSLYMQFSFYQVPLVILMYLEVENQWVSWALMIKQHALYKAFGSCFIAQSLAPGRWHTPVHLSIYLTICLPNHLAPSIFSNVVLSFLHLIPSYSSLLFAFPIWS